MRGILVCILAALQFEFKPIPLHPTAEEKLKNMLSEIGQRLLNELDSER
jgi:hypothetical protein